MWNAGDVIWDVSYSSEREPRHLLIGEPPSGLDDWMTGIGLSGEPESWFFAAHGTATLVTGWDPPYVRPRP